MPIGKNDNFFAGDRLQNLIGLAGIDNLQAIVMFSLVGLPPLAGFAAKFTIFASLFDARLLVLLAIGALNTVLSLFYYLRVVKVMVLHPEPDDRSTAGIPLSSVPGAYCVIIAVPLVVLGVRWNGLFDWAREAASLLF